MQWSLSLHFSPPLERAKRGRPTKTVRRLRRYIEGMAAIDSGRDSSLSPALVTWLSTPDAYPHRPADIERVETHISCVFLAGSEVYKLKKPVRFDFLDFS